MIVHYQVMNVAEFQCRHQEGASDEPQVSSEIVLVDVNGIPLTLEETITVKYQEGRPVAYCPCVEEVEDWDARSVLRTDAYRLL